MQLKQQEKQNKTNETDDRVRIRKEHIVRTSADSATLVHHVQPHQPKFALSVHPSNDANSVISNYRIDRLIATCAT